MTSEALGVALTTSLSRVKKWVDDCLAENLRAIGEAQFNAAARELDRVRETTDRRFAIWNAINHLQDAATAFQEASRHGHLGSAYEKVFDVEKELAAEYFLFACFLRLGETRRAASQLTDIADTMSYWGIDVHTGKFNASTATVERAAGATLGLYAHPLKSARLGVKIKLIQLGLRKEARAALPVNLVNGTSSVTVLFQGAESRLGDAELSS